MHRLLFACFRRCLIWQLISNLCLLILYLVTHRYVLITTNLLNLIHFLIPWTCYTHLPHIFIARELFDRTRFKFTYCKSLFLWTIYFTYWVILIRWWFSIIIPFIALMFDRGTKGIIWHETDFIDARLNIVVVWTTVQMLVYYPAHNFN